MRFQKIILFSLFMIILFSISGTSAYAATNYGYTTIKNEDYIQKIDLSDNTVKQTVYINGLDNVTSTPYNYHNNIVLSPDGTKYYVLGENGNLTMMSVTTDNIISSVQLGEYSITADTMFINKNGNELYIVHNIYLYIIDANTLNIKSKQGIANTGGYVGYASISADEKYIYIPEYEQCTKFNIPSRVLTTPFTIYSKPTCSYIDTTRNYIYFSGGRYDSDGYFYVYNLEDNTEVCNISFPYGSEALDIMLTSDSSFIGVALHGESKIAWINATSFEWTGNTSITNPQWITTNEDNTKWYVSSPDNNKITVIDSTYKTISSTITTNGGPGKLVISKTYSENTDIYTPHNIRYTLTSYIRVYPNVTATVYDTNNNYITGGVTDTSGTVVFQLYSNKYYTINFNGSGINKTITMYPIGTAYDIFIEPWSTWTWQLGSSQISDVDSVITAYINGEANGVDGTITVYYQDNGSTTENVLVTVYQRYNESTNQLIDFYMIEGSGASSFNHQFNLTSVVGKDYLVKVDAHSSKYGDIVKYQTYNFPSARYGIPGVNDDYVYMVLGICIPLFIALAVSLRNVKFGPVVFCGASWAFVSLNWMTMFGLAYPLLLTVASIVSVVYLISMKEERR